MDVHAEPRAERERIVSEGRDQRIAYCVVAFVGTLRLLHQELHHGAEQTNRSNAECLHRVPEGIGTEAFDKGSGAAVNQRKVHAENAADMEHRQCHQIGVTGAYMFELAGGSESMSIGAQHAFRWPGGA